MKRNIDSPPFLVFPTIGFKASTFTQILIALRLIIRTQMAKPRKKVPIPPKDVSPSTAEIEVNQFVKAPLFNANFDIWEARMMNFLKTQGIEVWELVITDNMMNGESKEYNAKAMKAMLNGLPDSIKRNLGKCSLVKGIWDKLHDLHSKGGGEVS